jgi:DNA-binding protein H-NS
MDEKDIMEKVLEFRDKAHADNVRKIKAGIKCIFTVPACFLILLFFTGSSKIIFLVLWIASLFIIAAYLIHVEYSDYKIQEMVNSLQDSEDSIDSLIDIDSIYTKVTEPKKRLDNKLDNIITNVKSDTQARIDSLVQIQSDIHEHMAARKSSNVTQDSSSESDATEEDITERSTVDGSADEASSSDNITNEDNTTKNVPANETTADTVSQEGKSS